MADLEVKGVNGTVSFDGRIIAIRREGALARMSHGKGEKRLSVSSVTAVQLKPASRLTRGFIQFTIPGGTEARGRAADAAKDENSVLFNAGQQAGFEALRDAIEAAL